MKLIKQKFINIPATASKMANFITSWKCIRRRAKRCYLRISKIRWYGRFAFSGFIYFLVITNDVHRNNRRGNWQLIWYLIRKPVTTLKFFAITNVWEKIIYWHQALKGCFWIETMDYLNFYKVDKLPKIIQEHNK